MVGVDTVNCMTDGYVVAFNPLMAIACLTFCSLLTDRPILGLPEYKLKVVNISKMLWTGGLEFVVL